MSPSVSALASSSYRAIPVGNGGAGQLLLGLTDHGDLASQRCRKYSRNDSAIPGRGWILSSSHPGVIRPKEATALLPATTPVDGTGRHISPQVAAALLSTIRAELTTQQVGFAVMRKLVLGFRTILRVGQLATLNRWMERASKTGIHALERFVRTLKQDLGAVEAAVTEPWSNGPVEGHINRLKMLKRQMYGRAGVELLRARLLPEPVFSAQSLHQT